MGGRRLERGERLGPLLHRRHQNCRIFHLCQRLLCLPHSHQATTAANFVDFEHEGVVLMSLGSKKKKKNFAQTRLVDEYMFESLRDNHFLGQYARVTESTSF